MLKIFILVISIFVLFSLNAGNFPIESGLLKSPRNIKLIPSKKRISSLGNFVKKKLYAMP